MPMPGRGCIPACVPIMPMPIAPIAAVAGMLFRGVVGRAMVPIGVPGVAGRTPPDAPPANPFCACGRVAGLVPSSKLNRSGMGAAGGGEGDTAGWADTGIGAVAVAGMPLSAPSAPSASLSSKSMSELVPPGTAVVGPSSGGMGFAAAV
jgi:hypothetical protein